MLLLERRVATFIELIQHKRMSYRVSKTELVRNCVTESGVDVYCLLCGQVKVKFNNSMHLVNLVNYQSQFIPLH